MKKILGLDLGSGSIGWAVVKEDENNLSVEAIGSRIIPLSPHDATEFTQGNAISKNAKRTMQRTQRKGYDRNQQRRANLTNFLREKGMLPDEALVKLKKLDLWRLRARAVDEQLSLNEIGRVLYHINQKRGYKATKADYDTEVDKKQGDYVKTVMGRHKAISERGITIGQLFFEELSKESAYRTKEQVFPRKAYEDEFDKIVDCQKGFYPQIFTDDVVNTLRNEIIFYQRGLKSCKHLVSICDFEKREYLKKDGKTIFDGPKVAPKSSPLAQICKIWESVNNITLKNRRGEELYILPEQRRAMFNHLDNSPKLTLTDLYKILGISKRDGWWGGKAIGKGLQGNTTKLAINKALEGEYPELLTFNITRTDTDLVDTETGEVVQIISDDYLKEPFYRLWHLIYSIKDKAELSKALQKQFNITDQTIIDNLFAVDFVKAGYANKSAKAMRRILPYLELGWQYSDACLAAGFRHSQSFTKEESLSRELQSKLKPIEKNELRQPIVEKILNQMINVVNALIDKYGQFDEVRVELARELKQSREERNETTRQMNENEKNNQTIARRISAEYNLTPTRSRIQKYKMWQEAEQICFYCGQPVSVTEFLRGFDVEIEHIIPRSLFFDDSFSNKVCSCRKCNKEKNNRTAYDYMRSKPDGEFNSYLERIERLYKEKDRTKKISKTKYERLLTPGDKIPTDFIDRQLRESQYIAKKSREILSAVCRDVTSTSGSVTDFIRRTWGYDKVLHNLNFNRYKLAGLTEIKEREHKNGVWSEEKIKDWTKRLDHRHHAIDALVIACTKQGYIQRINNMSELKDVIFAPDDKQGTEYKERKTKLEKYIESQPHISTAEVAKAADSILVSFKAGKKAASTGKRYIHRGGKRILVQEKIVVPRGALHEESVTGFIKRYDSRGDFVSVNVLKYKLGAGNGFLFNGKEDNQEKCNKVINSIIDVKVRELVNERLQKHNYKSKEAFKTPLFYDNAKKQQIVSVRCFTGFKSTLPVKYNDEGTPIGFSMLGNNHHIAIYVAPDGKRHELCVTFWHAVERKKAGIPIIISSPDSVWDNLPEGLSEEFLIQLPQPDWTFEVSLQQNEMFILGLEPEAFEEAMGSRDYAWLSKYLYRVQQIATKNYRFRHHLETSVDDKYSGIKNEMLSKKMGKVKVIQSFDSFSAQHPQKVRISLLGEISKV